MWRSFALSAVASAGMAACQLPGRAEGTQLQLAPCSLEGEPAECASFQVPLDRVQPGGTKLALAVSVVRSRQASEAPPVVFVAGGPGQGTREAFGAAIDAFEALRDRHDLVFIDQRGTGDSHPLRCENSGSVSLQDAVSLTVDAERLAACAAAQTVDLRHFTTADAIEDLSALLPALGYKTAHLLGVSYGTRVVLGFARAHPEQTASMVLDGVVTPDTALPLGFARDAQAALDAMVDDCAREPGCAQAFGGLRSHLDELLARETFEVELAHPRTGAHEQLSLTGRTVAAGIRGVLYTPELAVLLPMAIEAAHAGDWAPLIAQVSLFQVNVASGLSEAMSLSVLCSEDVPFLRDEDVAREAENTVFGAMFVKHLRTSCNEWPRAKVTPSWREPVQNDIPALVLSGELDPVTPPVRGEHARAYLSASRHIVVPGAGHGITTLPCADEVVAEFFSSGSADRVDASCLESRVRTPFFIDFAGPEVLR